MSKIEKIAKETNTAKSTVSKVLNHCGGVDYQLRERIISSAKKHIGNEINSAHRDIYIILPDNPKYFWQKAHVAVSECSFKSKIKLNLYSHIANSEKILDSYLDEAEEFGSKVLIVAGVLTPEQILRIEKLSTERLTIFFSIPNRSKNAFYVGADSFSDGYMLADAFRMSYPSVKKYLLITLNDSEYSKNRCAGFISGAGDAQIYLLRLHAEKSSLIPSLTARELARLGIAEDIDCIVSIDGVTHKIYAGTSKLKLKKTPCSIGFECSPADRVLLDGGNIQMLSCQDIRGQMLLALEFAHRFLEHKTFPDKKENCISSTLLKYV